MILLGVGHYNLEKQQQFAQFLVTAMIWHRHDIHQGTIQSLPLFQTGAPGIVTGVQTQADVDVIRERRGLLIKIVHPGVIPKTDAERELLDLDWDFWLGVNGDAESLIEDAQEFANWMGGHAARPEQSLLTQYQVKDLERKAIDAQNV
jgi:hypothetical protein